MGYFEDLTALDENIEINGVTMPERGISKVLSLRLGDDFSL